MSEAPTLALLGFGELADALCRRVREKGADAPLAFSRRRAEPAASERLRQRMQDAGARPAQTLAAAVSSADVVLACLPAGASEAVAAEAGEAMAAGTLYVDLASAAPEVKQRSAASVEAGGGDYVDAAVLGAVAASGGSVPILAAGTGARALGELAPRFGLAVTSIPEPAGAAARVKLLRSVYLKGRDALVAEMLLAARRHGLEATVADSVAGPGEEVPFSELAERILRSLTLHAGRRADELAASGELLLAAGVDPAATRGAERRLRLLAADTSSDP